MNVLTCLRIEPEQTEKVEFTSVSFGDKDLKLRNGGMKLNGTRAVLVKTSITSEWVEGNTFTHHGSEARCSRVGQRDRRAISSQLGVNLGTSIRYRMYAGDVDFRKNPDLTLSFPSFGDKLDLGRKYQIVGHVPKQRVHRNHTYSISSIKAIYSRGTNEVMLEVTLWDNDLIKSDDDLNLRNLEHRVKLIGTAEEIEAKLDWLLITDLKTENVAEAHTGESS
jgi:hypothetical protein